MYYIITGDDIEHYYIMLYWVQDILTFKILFKSCIFPYDFTSFYFIFYQFVAISVAI